jgi:predicted PP-loop superfamily ATPase
MIPEIQVHCRLMEGIIQRVPGFQRQQKQKQTHLRKIRSQLLFIDQGKELCTEILEKTQE